MLPWLPWRRVLLSAPMSVEELQARLAQLSERWSETGWSTPIPRPPWGSDQFTAVLGRLWLQFHVPVVVKGRIRSTAAGSQLEVTVRPHGMIFASLGLFLFLAAPLLPFRSPVPEVLPMGWIVLLGWLLAGYAILTGSLQKGFPVVLGTLEEACGQRPE